MLTFLRKIRKSLIDKGSTRKYLLYAIGEIALVVIGILIALQISNWNESRKTRNLELKLLSEMKTALLSDKNGIINRRLVNSKRNILYADELIHLLDNNLPYYDSMGYKFKILTNSTSISLSIAAYKSIESVGIQIIKNDTLRQGIVELFSKSIPYLQHTFENNRNNVLDFGRPLIRSKFKNIDGNYIPTNFEQLRQEVLLYNVIKSLKGNNASKISALEGVNREIEFIVGLIDNELN